MYSFLTFIVSGIILGLIIAAFIPKEVKLAPIIMFTLFGLVVGGVLSQSVSYNVEVRSVSKLQLESLTDNQSIEGSYSRSLFIGSGTLNGTMNYVIYYKKDEKIKMAVIEYDKVDIEYINNNEPYVEVFETFILKDEHNIFWHTLKTKNSEQTDNFKQTFTFHIPKGSIKNNFILDAQ